MLRNETLITEKPKPGLFETVEKLINQNVKIGVLIIDEDIRMRDDNRLPEDSHVDFRQEQLVRFANRHQLPLWFIESDYSTRETLTKLAQTTVATIQKGDSNGFGTGLAYNEQFINSHPDFIDTGLHASLQKKQITHLIILGFHVNCCVELTVGASRSQINSPTQL